MLELGKNICSLIERNMHLVDLAFLTKLEGERSNEICLCVVTQLGSSLVVQPAILMLN